MIGGHLVSVLGGIAVSLLNLVGVTVFYVALRDVFSPLHDSTLVVLLTVAGLRIGFCVLVVRAADASGIMKWCCLFVVALISSMPALCAPERIGASITFQIGLDVLIVVLIIATRSGNRSRGSVQEMMTSYFGPEQSTDVRHILENYGVEEFGSLYLYLPRPSQKVDDRTEAYARILRAKNVIGDPYRVYARCATTTARSSLPDLFDRNPLLFEVYRVDRDRLERMLTAC